MYIYIYYTIYIYKPLGLNIKRALDTSLVLTRSCAISPG